MRVAGVQKRHMHGTLMVPPGLPADAKHRLSDYNTFVKGATVVQVPANKGRARPLHNWRCVSIRYLGLLPRCSKGVALTPCRCTHAMCLCSRRVLQCAHISLCMSEPIRARFTQMCERDECCMACDKRRICGTNLYVQHWTPLLCWLQSCDRKAH